MPSKPARRGEEKSIDLLSFLGGGSETKKGVSAEVAGSPDELGHAVTSFLRSKGGKAAKSELYEWAKKKGIPPAALYNTIAKMLRSGALRRSFDENFQEIVFTLTS